MGARRQLDDAHARRTEPEPAATPGASTARIPAIPADRATLAETLARTDSATRAREVLALQRRGGNAAVGRMLAAGAARLHRHEDEGGTAVMEPAAVPAGPAAGPAATTAGQQAAEAEAVETVTRLRQAQQSLVASANITERNTGQLFEGPTPRTRYTPMTQRSDSEAIRAARGQAPGTKAYYFKGVIQPAWGGGAALPAGTLEHGPTTLGTIESATSTIVVRGKGPGGAWQSESAIKGTFTHESSHILVASYGEHPGTATSDASFDRYRDEFRAYWVEQSGYFSTLAPDDKFRAIRRQLVGTSATDTAGYATLRAKYWSDPAFKTQVDGHTRPDGFNLTNSPRLDRLFTALGEAATDPTKIDEVVLAILSLEPAERAQAHTSPLIRQRAHALGGDSETRVQRALSTPTHDAYTGSLNPSRSPRIAALLQRLALNHKDEIKAGYNGLTPAERGEIHFDAAVMVFIDHHVVDPKQRACVYAMVLGRSSTQYDAMEDFLDECFLTFMDSALTMPSGPPPELMAKLRRVTLFGRLSLYRMVEDARQLFVDSLPDPVKRPVISALRGDSEP